MDGSEKVQNYADVIYGWFLVELKRPLNNWVALLNKAVSRRIWLVNQIFEIQSDLSIFQLLSNFTK